MKGIVLAGGTGSRLHPMTVVVNKHLLPIYDKPMVYYPLSLLLLAGIRDILLISGPRDLPQFKELLGDGSHIGVRFEYAVQRRPEGIAQAFLVGQDFIGADSVCLILGDNILYSTELQTTLARAAQLEQGALIFGYPVKDPQRYAVIEFSATGQVADVHEKPANPTSHYAVPGLYFYDNDVVEIARRLRPSARGEFEITDVNREYLRRGRLNVERFSRGVAWLDAGTCDSLVQAASFVQTIEQRQGLKIACIEEIAWRMGFIDDGQLRRASQRFGHADYSAYLAMCLQAGR